jgi:quercetin dioxygenase-like cupin family protein
MAMNTATPADLSMIEATYEGDPTMRVRFNWPVFAGTGASSSSVVYGEIEPGHRLGTHQDSAEEVLLILEGIAEATVGDESRRLEAGQLAVIPALSAHGLANVGTGRLRYLGFFPSATSIAIFDQPLMPVNQRVVGSPDWMQARGLLAPHH